MEDLLTSKLRIKDDVLIQELGGEAVFLNLESEEYFGTDDIGTDMLMTLKEMLSIQEAYDRLLEKYDVEPEQLKQDLLDFIEKLIQHGLVKITDS